MRGTVIVEERRKGGKTTREGTYMQTGGDTVAMTPICSKRVFVNTNFVPTTRVEESRQRKNNSCVPLSPVS